jgi:hypothetical protein
LEYREIMGASRLIDISTEIENKMFQLVKDQGIERVRELRGWKRVSMGSEQYV